MANVHEEAETEVGETSSILIPALAHEAEQDRSPMASTDKEEEGPEATVHYHKPPALQDRAQTVRRWMERGSWLGGPVQAGFAPNAESGR